MARDLVDVLAGDGDGQRFGAEPLAVAGRAGAHAHVLFELAADVVAGRLLVAALQVGDHAAEGRLVVAILPFAVGVVDADLLALLGRAPEDDVALLEAQLLDGHAEGDAVLLADGAAASGGSSRRRRPRSGARQGMTAPSSRDSSSSKISSGSNSWSVPRPVQAGQAPCGLLKREGARLDFGQAGAAVDAGKVLAEGAVLAGCRGRSRRR